jgi:hypothetical protein
MIVTGALGVLDVGLIRSEGQMRDALDAAIAGLGTRRLPKSQRRTFFCAFHCESSWQRVRDLLNELRPEPLPLATVEKYGRDALKRLGEEANNFEPLRAWLKQYQTAKRSA